MKVTIGSCSGPLDATLVRAYFELHDIPITITQVARDRGRLS